VLLDGDGAVVRNTHAPPLTSFELVQFKKEFLQDPEEGGRRAARNLRQAVETDYREQHKLEPETLLVFSCCKATGLAKFLAACGDITTNADFQLFMASFTAAAPFFQFIDCGAGKEGADAKIKGEAGLLK
jgi:hypothetical protein